MMLTQQIIEFAMWIGVIMVSPLLFRFSYAASALLWRRLFPVRKFEFVFVDKVTNDKRSVTIVMPKDKSKTIVQLIEEATKDGASSNV